MCLIDYCDWHPLAHGTTFPLALPCIINKSLQLTMDLLAMLECNGNYHYGNHCSFLVSNKVSTQYSLVNLCVPTLKDIEEEIIFYYPDDDDGHYDN